MRLLSAVRLPVAPCGTRAAQETLLLVPWVLHDAAELRKMQHQSVLLVMAPLMQLMCSHWHNALLLCAGCSWLPAHMAHMGFRIPAVSNC